ncbi:MAG: hypothetical protein LBV63_04750 [Candidatus Methanoplasma sp.]|jgi:hypothetical protein|nr:hypothetical protein [Candidatus Methanoplasma sp.]
MNFKKLMMVLAVLAVFATPFTVLADSSDAYIEIDANRDLYGSGFTNSGSGTLHIPLSSTEGTDVNITITVTYKDSGDRVTDPVTFTVPAGSKDFVAEMSFRISDVGSHELQITCTPATLFPLTNVDTVTVTVNQTIWSQWTTFAAIGIVALLIVIAAFIRMRSVPTTKPDTTFTELEKGRGSVEKAEPEKKPTVSTERKRYNTSSEPAKSDTKKSEKKPEPKPEPQEKKTESFTELQKQKSEKKAIREAEEKPSKDGEPKKLKYVSSRRK